MLLSSVNRPLLIYLRSVKSRMSVRLRKIVAYSLPEKRGEVLLTRKLDFEGHGPPLSVMKSGKESIGRAAFELENEGRGLGRGAMEQEEGAGGNREKLG